MAPLDNSRRQGRLEVYSLVFIIIHQAKFLEEAREKIIKLYDQEHIEMEKERMYANERNDG
jgi:hypothetical protein